MSAANFKALLCFDTEDPELNATLLQLHFRLLQMGCEVYPNASDKDSLVVVLPKIAKETK